MIKLIAAFTMILLPIISVSTGTTDSESVLRARDEIDEWGCTIEHGCPGDPNAPFTQTTPSRGQ